MRIKHVLALAFSLSVSAMVTAQDTFDMGKVQVTGADEQSGKISVSSNDVSFGAEDKEFKLPELTPEAGKEVYRPITEKKPITTFQKQTPSEASVAVGAGSRNGTEFILQGKGSHQGYNGEAMFFAENEDGYRSVIDTKKVGLNGNVTTTTEKGAVFSVNGEYLNDKFGLRGTRTAPTPKAKIETDKLKLGFGGSVTQSDGAFVTGEANISRYDRDIESGIAGHIKNQKITSLDLKLTYVKKSENKFRNKAAFEFKSEDLKISGLEKDQDFNKAVGLFGTDYSVSEKTNLGVGFKIMKSMERDATSPYATLNHKLSDSLMLSFSYDEDLKNDSYEDIFITNHYVTSSNREIKASRQKTAKASLNFKTDNNDTFGVDFFTQEEDDAIEYSDDYDNNLHSSVYDFVDAKRTGIKFKSNFKLEKRFTFNIGYTFQNPRNDDDDRRLSYEPRRMLDVALNYSKSKFSIDFSRKTEYDRRARIYQGAVPHMFDVKDYSRSDVALKYIVNETYSAYLKIKDLYDEEKTLRYDVPEQGRTILGGIEAHF